ncbi:MAG TPA: hypothetical protein VKU02_29945, partial [Gemmataceae bacterium]|nr:hypothetical protein [Gemmataceae bacterium]
VRKKITLELIAFETGINAIVILFAAASRKWLGVLNRQRAARITQSFPARHAQVQCPPPLVRIWIHDLSLKTWPV